MEYVITLHTPKGDVITSYPENMKEGARDLVTAYFNDGKQFSFESVASKPSEIKNEPEVAKPFSLPFAFKVSSRIDDRSMVYEASISKSDDSIVEIRWKNGGYTTYMLSGAKQNVEDGAWIII